MAKKKTTTDQKISFEESLGKLEAIVRDLEGGDLSLDDSLKAYEQGVALLRNCHGQLKSAQRKVELLEGIDEEGTAQTKPFDDDATFAANDLQ